MNIYTCNVGDPIMIKMLQTSCDRYGVKLNVYNDGDNHFKNNRRIKIDLMIQYLEGIRDKYVIYTDGWDSWFVRDPKQIRNVYQKYYPGKIVISGNKSLYPQQETSDGFNGKTSYKYICAGGMMGPRLKLLDTLKRIDKLYEDQSSDQLGWIKLYQEDKNAFIIDEECRIFQTMFGVVDDDVVFENGEFINTETKSKPFILHFGGPKGGSGNHLRMERYYEKWYNYVK